MKTKKIVAFAGSNSSKSINKELVDYVVRQLNNVRVDILDLNEYEMPVYSIDKEMQYGVLSPALDFIRQMHEADGVVISLAEHNGNITVALKNVLDWASRSNMDIFAGKPVMLLSTSPGRGGAQAALRIGEQLMQRFNGKLVTQFSLPSFNHNFAAKQITHDELRRELQEKIKLFEGVLVEQEVEIQ